MSRPPLCVMPTLALVFVISLGINSSSTGSWAEYAVNPVLRPGTSGSWDDGLVASAEVVYDGTLYRMWYTGRHYGSYIDQLGYATSADGITWTKYAQNPVLQFGGGWETSIEDVAVILDGSVWKMWYTGARVGGSEIGYASSTDGITWTRYPTPVLSYGMVGTWDSIGVFAPTVMHYQGAYQMWYSGTDGFHIRIGYATSTNGIDWVKYGDNPVLDIGPSYAWDSQYVVSPSVIFLNGEYHTWYQGSSGGTQTRFGHATSLDGITWTKDSSNPILTPGISGSWDDYGIFYPAVIYQDGLLRMWFHGEANTSSTTQMIGYAQAFAGKFNVFVPFIIR